MIHTVILQHIHKGVLNIIVLQQYSWLKAEDACYWYMRYSIFVNLAMKDMASVDAFTKHLKLGKTQIMQ